jgi:hypothetical protein
MKYFFLSTAYNWIDWDAAIGYFLWSCRLSWMVEVEFVRENGPGHQFVHGKHSHLRYKVFTRVPSVRVAQYLVLGVVCVCPFIPFPLIIEFCPSTFGLWLSL